MNEKEKIEKEEILCKDCPIVFIDVCCSCKGKNQYLVDQLLRDLSDTKVPRSWI